MSSTLVRKLNPLTSLRFVAAAMIVVQHLKGVFGVPEDVGARFPFGTGVSFFFVLSGFILTYVYSSQPTLAKRRFLLARLARVWPAHVVALVSISLLLPQIVGSQFSIPKLLANLVLVHSWIPLRDYYFSFVAPSWSISTEFGFYLCFLWLIHDWQRTWHWKLALTAALLCATIAFGNALILHYPGPRNQEIAEALAHFNPLSRLFEFTLGMSVALLWKRASPRIQAGIAAGTLIEIAAVGVTLFTMLHCYSWAAAAGRVPWIGFAGKAWLSVAGPCAAFALLIFVMALGRGAISMVLSMRLPVLLGEISYSLYLMHQMAIVFIKVNAKAFAILPNWLGLTLYSALVLTVAWLVWALVERPCRHFLVRLWPTKSNTVTGELPASMITPSGAPVNTHRERILLPSRAGFFVAFSVFAILMSGGIYLARFRPTIDPLSAVEAERIAAGTFVEMRDVRFGERFILRGFEFKSARDGLALDLVWQSIGEQRLEYLAATHFVDGAGKIVGQSDHPQDRARASVSADMLWHDVIPIPASKARGATAVAVGFLRESEWLPADRGTRDWDGRRLLIPLPDMPPPAANAVATSQIAGFFEVANCKQIVGWVWDSKRPDAALDVEILDDDRVVARVSAAEVRPDLETGKVGTGRYGFRLATPPELKDGKPHNIHARVVGASFELKNSPRTFTCKRD